MLLADPSNPEKQSQIIELNWNGRTESDPDAGARVGNYRRRSWQSKIPRTGTCIFACYGSDGTGAPQRSRSVVLL
jgi:hypothetical protein